MNTSTSGLWAVVGFPAVTGPQLMKIRKALGLDRKAFARKLGIARGLVKEYEESARVRKTVALAARALQAGLDDR